MKGSLVPGLGKMVCFLAFSLIASFSAYCQSTTNDAVPVQFEVFGQVQHNSYKWDTSSNYTETAAFHLTVSDCRWFLHLQHDNAFESYSEVSFDGEKSYWLQSLQKWIDALKATNAPLKSIPTNVAVGVVRRSSVPRFPFASESGIIWLTYASGCYFRAQKEEMVDNPATLSVVDGFDADPDYFVKTKAAWHLVDAAPYVPTEVTYLSDTAHRSRLHPLRYPAPFDRGYTNTVFQSVIYTNIEGFMLPVSSTLRTYAIDEFTTNKPALVLQHEYRLIATNFVPSVTLADFQPTIPGLTVVSDERFNDEKHRSLHFNYYNIKRWSTDAEARGTPGYRNALATARGSIPGNRSTVLLMFIFFISAPLVWWAAMSQFRRKTQLTQLEKTGSL